MATSTSTTTATTPPTPAQRQDVISALQAVITAAQAEMALPATTRDVAASDRDIITTASAEILRQQLALSQPSAATYRVRMGDTLFGIAQDQLGDRLLYRGIQQANNMSWLALTPGQTLVLPKT